MAKKKVYAVKKGKKTGLFYTWSECREAVSGYSGAEFRGFQTQEDAEAYLNMYLLCRECRKIFRFYLQKSKRIREIIIMRK